MTLLARLLAVAWAVALPRHGRAQAAPDSGAAALIEQGQRHVQASRFDSARAAYAAARASARAAGDREREGAALYATAAVDARIGRPDSALAHLRPALSLTRARGDRAGEARVLATLGEVFRNVGRTDSALAVLRQSLALRRSLGDRSGEASSLAGIGAVYAVVGRTDSALVYLHAAVPVLRVAGNREGEAEALSAISSLYNELRRPDSALVYQRATLALVRATGDRAGETLALSNVGALLRELGHADSAIAYHRAALPLLREFGDRVGEASALENLGAAFRRLRQYDSALVYLRAALVPSRAAGDRTREATTRGTIAQVMSEARHSSFRVVAALDTAIAQLVAVRMQAGGDANAIAYAERERRFHVDWVGTWLATWRAIGRLPDSVVQARRLPSADAALRSALAVAERGHAPALRDLLARHSGAYPADVRALLAADTIPGADLAAEGARLLEPLRRSRSAALHYYTSDAAVVAWYVSPAGELRLVTPRQVPPDSITALITALRTGLGADTAGARLAFGPAATRPASAAAVLAARGGADASAAAAALGALLVPAALRDLPVGTELVLVPHGAIAQVPFAALVAPGDSVPLGVRYALRYTPSLRALAVAESRAAPGAGAGGASALVVGDPRMPSVVAPGGQRATLRPLTGARGEGRAVARMLGVRPLTGAAATEGTVRAALATASVVHLATHGLAFGSDAQVRESFVALAPDAEHDGLLTVGELLDETPAIAADLVVLSACQTGLGDVRHTEGTVGFQRAFLARGARSVLVSLWSVDDRATALLMGHFYEHWRPARGASAGRSKAEALRLAQADLRAVPAFSSPRYWAAFQLVGAR